MAAKKPASPPPRTQMQSRTPSAAHGCTRTNTPQVKRAPTTAKDPSKPPASILEILQSKPPAPGKGLKTLPLTTSAAPHHSFAMIAMPPLSPIVSKLPPIKSAITTASLGSPQLSGCIKTTFSLSLAPSQVEQPFWSPKLDN